MELQKIIKQTQDLVNKKLNELLPDDEEVLTKAMRYSLLCKGKRLRPLLVLETSRIFTNAYNDDAITVAAAIEMIHIFSLIHDDLPGMDNDDYRRGELTCHKKFTEYDAILAGDSLIPLASEIIITKTKNLTNQQKLDIILKISQAIGYKGMCLGQSLDVEIEKNNKFKSAMEAERINTFKTGYLFKSCIEIGCILSNTLKEEQEILTNYSLNFGKAFQLMDDLEDDEIKPEDKKTTQEKILKLVDNCKNELGKLKNKNPEALNTLKLIAEFCIK